MDTDPPMCLDYIFYKGDGIKIEKVIKTGDQPDPSDPTIYGSDHMALVADFDITL